MIWRGAAPDEWQLYLSPYILALPVALVSHYFAIIKPLIKYLQLKRNSKFDDEKRGSQLQSNHDSFLAVILDPELFEQFKHFSVKEFCTENVVFLEEFFQLHEDILLFLHSKKMLELPNFEMNAIMEMKKHFIRQAIDQTSNAFKYSTSSSTNHHTMKNGLIVSVNQSCQLHVFKEVLDDIAKTIPVPTILLSKFLAFYQLFLANQSPMEVNIPASIKETVIASLKNVGSFATNAPHSQAAAADNLASSSFMKLDSEVPDDVVARYSAASPSIVSAGAAHVPTDQVHACDHLLRVDVFHQAKDDVVRSLLLNTFPRFLAKRKTLPII